MDDSLRGMAGRKKALDMFRSLRAGNGAHTIGQRLNRVLHAAAPQTRWVLHDPVTISIIATGRCNLACEMCPTHSKVVPSEYEHLQEPTRDMTIAVFKEVAARFKYATTVNFIGSGEPLMIKDFFPIVEHATSVRRMVVKSFSNGILIRDHVEQLARSSLEGMSISVNSDDADDFQRITAMPAKIYPTIIENARRLRSAVDAAGSSLQVKCSFIVDQQNYRSIPSMIALADDLGADRVYFGNYLGNPYGDMSAEKRSLWDTPDVLEFLREVRVPDHMSSRVHLPVLLERSPSRRACTCHWDQVRVNGDGRVGSCSVMLLDSYIGTDFREKRLFNNPVFRERRSRFMSTTAELESPCYHCPDNIGREPVD